MLDSALGRELFGVTVFGPHFIVAASAGLIFALHRLDRAPPPMPDTSHL